MLPLFAIVILCMGSAYAQQDAPAPALIGYVDENRDGINDRFRDADGDGIDDISAKPYPHRFRFVDEDADGPGRASTTDPHSVHVDEFAAKVAC